MGAVKIINFYMMNNTRKIPLESSDSQKNSYDATGLTDRTPTSPIEVGISTITVNFAKISQDSLIFAVRASLDTAQKINFLGGAA